MATTPASHGTGRQSIHLTVIIYALCYTRNASLPASSKPAFQPQHLAHPQAALALRIPSLVHHLGISLTLIDPGGWHAVHTVPNVLSFELEHGVEVKGGRTTSGA